MGVMSWSDDKKKKKLKGCFYCNGRGYTDFGKCDICRGSGKNTKEKSK